jgi:hypothetical protein
MPVRIVATCQSRRSPAGQNLMDREIETRKGTLFTHDIGRKDNLPILAHDIRRDSNPGESLDAVRRLTDSLSLQRTHVRPKDVFSGQCVLTGDGTFGQEVVVNIAEKFTSARPAQHCLNFPGKDSAQVITFGITRHVISYGIHHSDAAGNHAHIEKTAVQQLKDAGASVRLGHDESISFGAVKRDVTPVFPNVRERQYISDTGKMIPHCTIPIEVADQACFCHSCITVNLHDGVRFPNVLEKLLVVEHVHS